LDTRRIGSYITVVLTASAGLIGLYFGWYYGAILGYWLWPNSAWMGAVFSYFIGMPFGVFAALWLVTGIISKAFTRTRKLPSPR
jgi:hypothetical protein